MSEKRRPRTLHYVEDYLENSLYILEAEKRPEVDVKIEEEKEESLKIRVISVTLDGGKTEVVSEVPRLFLREIPLLTPITVMHPLKSAQPMLPLGGEVSAEVKIQPPHKTEYVLQMSIKVFDREVRRISPLYLPLVSPTFYSWLGIDVKPMVFPEYPGVNAFTSNKLLRLIEILLRLPRAAEQVKSSVNAPALTSSTLPIQNEVKTALTATAEMLHTKAQVQQLRGKGLLELLLPEEEKLRRLRGASGEYVGEPILIVLPESKDHLWYLFWIACREFYKEVRGAYPEPAILLNRGCKLWLRHPGALSGKIVVLRKRDVVEGDDKEWFRRRLQEAFSQGLGFLIIMAEEVEETVAFIKELCKPYTPMIVDIHTVPGINYVSETLAKTLNTGFGIPYSEVCRVDDLKMEDKVAMIVEGKLREYPQLDIMVSRVDRAYRNLLKELLSSSYLAYIRRDVGEMESEDHIAMKILAVKYINEKLSVKPEKIACTFEVGDKVVADIYVEEKALAVECETVLGVSPAPLLKILESVRKYTERAITKPVNEIWVIIRNWPAILNLGDLLWAENILREELKKQGKEVKFFIPDVYGKSLKPIVDIAKTILLLNPPL
jgi:hypothetical protein